MTDPSGSHAARRRGTTIAHVDLGPTVRRPTGEGGAPLPAREEAPMRPSDPPPSWKTIKALIPTITLLLGSAGTAGTLYATYTSRIDAVQAQMTETVQALTQIEASSRARDEELAARLQVVERDAAVRETEQRATTRALETLTEEIREIHRLLQRRRP